MNRSAVICSILFILAGSGIGCYSEKQQTPTSGTLNLLIAESVAPPVIQQVEAFLDLYGDRGADIRYMVVPSLDAVKGFISDTFEVAIAVDSLTAPETEIVDAMEGSFLVRAAAFDGIAIVTHPDNPVELLKTTQIREILNGSVKKWSDVETGNRRGHIRIVLQPASDVSRFLERTVMAGRTITVADDGPATSMEVLSAVLNARGAIGFIGMTWLDSANMRLHTPKVFMDHPEAEAWYTVAPEASEFAYGPHPANILRGYYALGRRVYILSRSPLGGNLATGFAAFVLNSAGQRIFFDAGMIPATQTIRIN